MLGAQEQICLKVLNMYRHVIMKVDMSDITWNQLLIVLVHVSKHILRDLSHSSYSDEVLIILPLIYHFMIQLN